MLLPQLAAREAESKLVEAAKEVTAAKAAAGEWQARQTATQQQLAAREREASEQDAQIKVIFINLILDVCIAAGTQFKVACNSRVHACAHALYQVFI